MSKLDGIAKVAIVIGKAIVKSGKWVWNNMDKLSAVMTVAASAKKTLSDDKSKGPDTPPSNAV